jgi:cation transport ATPase
MAQSDPGHEPAPDADPGTTSAAGAETESEAKTEPKTEAELKAEAEAKQQLTVSRFLWSCAWLTVLVGVFLLSGMARAGGGYNVFAWLGAVVAVLCLLALIAAYAACARNKLALRTRLLGRFDVFQLSTAVVAIAVICGLLVPNRNSSALALLFPWALTYWMYGLDRTKEPAS